MTCQGFAWFSFVILCLKNLSYHISRIFILISSPLFTIRRVQQLEVCRPFISISFSLSSYTTHLNYFSNINLEPVIGPASLSRTPAAVASGTM